MKRNVRVTVHEIYKHANGTDNKLWREITGNCGGFLAGGEREVGKCELACLVHPVWSAKAVRRRQYFGRCRASA